MGPGAFVFNTESFRRVLQFGERVVPGVEHGGPVVCVLEKESIKSVVQACNLFLSGGAEFGTGVPLLVCWKRDPS